MAFVYAASTKLCAMNQEKKPLLRSGDTNNIHMICEQKPNFVPEAVEIVVDVKQSN